MASFPPSRFCTAAVAIAVRGHSGDIGQSAKPIVTQVGNIEGQSNTGDIWVNNRGNLAVGGVVSMNAPGLSAGGAIHVTASSPMQVQEDVIAYKDIVLRAMDSAGSGDHLTVLSGVTIWSRGLLVGGAVQAGVRVVARWRTGADKESRTESGPDGVFALCGLPADLDGGRMISIQVDGPGNKAESVQLAKGEFRWLDLGAAP